LVELFRDKVKSRGARGIIGLQRVFKIVDDNNSKTLDIYEFSKVVKDYRIEMSEDEVKKLFTLFDRNGDQSINYDEFLREIVGGMN
jgi:Ca2+-binding EF-hand superfamily protein